MTRSVGAALLNHFGQETTTIATLWKVTRRDSTVLGFTDTVNDIVFSGTTYKAATGFTPSDVALKSDLSVSNLEVDSVLDSTTLTESDLIGGLYDYSLLEIYMVNYKDLTMGAVTVKRGYLGQVSIHRNQFSAEIRGLSQALQNKFGELYSPSCRAILGDARCTKDLTAFTFSGTITTAQNNQIFTCSALTQAQAYFTGGQVNFTSGLNSGLSMEIKAFTSPTVTLVMAMPNNLAAGQTFNIIAGCDKLFATCQTKFNNVVNFRGEPYVPGMDVALSTAGTFQ